MRTKASISGTHRGGKGERGHAAKEVPILQEDVWNPVKA